MSNYIIPQLSFPTEYMEHRPATRSGIVRIVSTADTKKDYSDLLLKMTCFLKEETKMISEVREEIRKKYPHLLSAEHG